MRGARRSLGALAVGVLIVGAAPAQEWQDGHSSLTLSSYGSGALDSCLAHTGDLWRHDSRPATSTAFRLVDLQAEASPPPDRDFFHWGYTRDIDGWGLVAWGATLGLVVPFMASGDTDRIQELGDVTQFLPSVIGGTASLFEDSWEGTKQFAYSGLTTFGVTHGLKYAVERTRPDATDANSFPSGHTSFSFQGASFIGTRYGPRFGLSAYTLALYTAYSRVEGQKHFIDDTLAGASFALFSNWLFVTPYEQGKSQSRIRVEPAVYDGGFGLNLSSTIGPRRSHRFRLDDVEARPSRDLVWRYELEFGTAWTARNEVRAPSATGTTLHYEDYDTVTNPDAYALGSLEARLRNRWEFMFRLAPYEVRDSATFTQPVSFAGQTFAAGTATNTGYVFIDYRLRARYDFFPDSRWIVKAGASASLIDVEASLSNANASAKVREVLFTGGPHATFGYRLSDAFRVLSELDYAAGPYFEAKTKFIWQVDEDWDLGIGYHFIDGEFETTDMFNSVRQHRALLSIAYTF